jgi:hypothetical protein
MQPRPEERERLIRYIDFLEDELSDFGKFAMVSWKKYQEDRDIRRNLERWIENIVNIEARYPDFRRSFRLKCTEEYSKQPMAVVKEVYQWLRSQITSNKVSSDFLLR